MFGRALRLRCTKACSGAAGGSRSRATRYTRWELIICGVEEMSGARGVVPVHSFHAPRVLVVVVSHDLKEIPSNWGHDVAAGKCVTRAVSHQEGVAA